MLLHIFFELLVDLRAAVAGYFEACRSGHFEVVEDLADEPTVPEKGLGYEVVDTVRVAKLDIGDSFIEGKVGGEE